MYGYDAYTSITEAEILSKVSEEEIFQIFIHEPIIVEDQLYVAPYRKDDNPGCWFTVFGGQLQFVDFALEGTIKNNNCFWFIAKCTGLSYSDALEYIGNKLNLRNVVADRTFEIPENEIVSLDAVERNKMVLISKRPFNIKDKLYWEKYGISRLQLEEDKVYPINSYRFTSRKGNLVTITPNDITYAYTEFEDNKVKVYRPKNKDFKWLTNCGADDIGSINHLIEKGEILILTKSYKDCRVVRNEGYSSVWLQSESMFPSKKVLKNLCKRFKRIYVLWDNDSTGLSCGKSLTEHINTIKPNCATHIFLPPRLLLEGIKDPSDLIAKKGKEELTEFLKTKVI